MKKYKFNLKDLDIEGEGYNPEDALRDALENISTQEVLGKANYKESLSNPKEERIVINKNKTNYFLDYIFAMMAIVLAFSLVSFLLMGGNYLVSLILFIISSSSMIVITKINSRSKT